MISYFLAKSQWGTASEDKTGIVPPLRSTILSSAPFPSGTDSSGRLGIITSSSWIFSSASFNSVLYTAELSFKDATSSLAAAASSFLPSFIRLPMDLDKEFIFANVLSNIVCELFRWVSRSIIWSIMSLASKCFLANLRTISSLFSFITLSVSIVQNYVTFYDCKGNKNID